MDWNPVCKFWSRQMLGVATRKPTVLIPILTELFFWYCGYRSVECWFLLGSCCVAKSLRQQSSYISVLMAKMVHSVWQKGQFCCSFGEHILSSLYCHMHYFYCRFCQSYICVFFVGMLSWTCIARLAKTCSHEAFMS